MYRSALSTPTELKDAIQQIVSEIYRDILYSAVTGVVIRRTCSVQYSGDHAEQLQVK